MLHVAPFKTVFSHPVIHDLQNNFIVVKAVTIFLLRFLLPKQPQSSQSRLRDHGLSAFNLAAPALVSLKLTPSFLN